MLHDAYDVVALAICETAINASNVSELSILSKQTL